LGSARVNAASRMLMKLTAEQHLCEDLFGPWWLTMFNHYRQKQIPKQVLKLFFVACEDM